MSYNFVINADGSKDQPFTFDWKSLPFDFKEYQVSASVKCRFDTGSGARSNMIILTNLFNGCTDNTIVKKKLGDYDTQWVLSISPPFVLRPDYLESTNTSGYMGSVEEPPVTYYGVPNTNFKISYTSTNNVNGGNIFALGYPCMVNLTFLPLER